MGAFAVWMIFLASAGLLAPVTSGVPPLPSSPSGLLLIENKGDHTLGFVDPAAAKEVTVITLSGVTGHEVATSPDGRFAYAPIYGDSGVGEPGSDGRTIDVIDVAGRRLADTIDLGKPVRPHCPVYGPDGLLYVTAELAHAIYVIDPHTRKLIASISTEQPESHMLAITRDGKRGYTSNVGAGTVTALDLVNRKPIAVIHVCKVAQRISLSADDRFVFTADQNQPRIAVIDTQSNSLRNWIALPGIAFGTRATPDGSWLLATMPGMSQIAVVDLRTMKVSRTIQVPGAPQEILIAPDQQTAYISCDRTRQIAVLNLGSWSVEKTIRVGRNDDGMAWAQGQ
jgi:DNA-binding beta-propeller fold protein YncE